MAAQLGLRVWAERCKAVTHLWMGLGNKTAVILFPSLSEQVWDRQEVQGTLSQLHLPVRCLTSLLQPLTSQHKVPRLPPPSQPEEEHYLPSFKGSISGAASPLAPFTGGFS